MEKTIKIQMKRIRIRLRDDGIEELGSKELISEDVGFFLQGHDYHLDNGIGTAYIPIENGSWARCGGCQYYRDMQGGFCLRCMLPVKAGEIGCKWYNRSDVVKPS